MTRRNIDKINALRAEADTHGDERTVATCDAALAGDAAALARLGIVVRAAKAAKQASDRKGQRTSAWAAPVREDDQSLEDLTGLPRR